MKLLLIVTTALLSLAALPSHVSASEIDFSLLSSAPVGSWQLREEIQTNHKGKQTGSSMRTSMVGTEMRDGEKHYWIEMAMESFKVKKNGKRKKQGDRAIVKSLIPESLMTADPANVLNNLRGFGVETIIQNGNDDPMRMGDTDGMMAGMMKAFNTEIEYDFESLGKETVAVPAGEFASKKIRGTGSVSMKVVFKNINVDSDTTTWVSEKVPFGVVKSEGTSTTNGKQSTHTAELLEFGLTGAKSEITKEPQDMPDMPKIGELFGG